MILRPTKTGVGSGATLTAEDPSSGTADGSTLIFTFAHEPVFVQVGRAFYSDGDGYTLSGSGPYTVTFDSGEAPWTTPHSFYNA